MAARDSSTGTDRAPETAAERKARIRASRAPMRGLMSAWVAEAAAKRRKAARTLAEAVAATRGTKP